MRKLSPIIQLLPLLLLVSRSSANGSSSTSNIPLFDNYYQADNQELTYFNISQSIEMNSVPSVGQSKLLSLIDQNKNTRYSSSALARASYDTLFVSGSSFTFADYKSAFPLGVKSTMNDESSFPFTLEFISVNSTSAQVKIRLS